MNGVGEPCSTMYRSSLPPANSSQCSAGDVYRVVRALFYARETMIEVLQLAASLAREHDGALSASLFGTQPGLGRKRAIRILEFFDRVGYLASSAIFITSVTTADCTIL